MATYARKLKDGNGSYICPVTRSDLVYFPDNTVLSKLTFYPVGSVYQSFENTSPASLFGGEWTKLENTFLYGSGSRGVGTTGGEEVHQLSLYEMPRHAHGLTQGYTNSLGPENMAVAKVHYEGTSDLTEYTGGDQPHNNMPPYTVINIWKRTA